MILSRKLGCNLLEFNDVLMDEHLILRQLTSIDVSQKYLSWLHDYNVNKFLVVGLNPPSLAQQIQYVQECLKSNNKILLGIFTVNNDFIGTLKLTIKNAHNAEIGIMIGDLNHQGKGYGKLAINLVKDWALDNKIWQLEAGYFIDNLPSSKLFQSCGFVEYERNLFPLDEGYSTVEIRVRFKFE